MGVSGKNVGDTAGYHEFSGLAEQPRRGDDAVSSHGFGIPKSSIPHFFDRPGEVGCLRCCEGIDEIEDAEFSNVHKG